MESRILGVFLSRFDGSARAFARAAIFVLAGSWGGVAIAQDGDREVVGGDPIFDPDLDRRVIGEAKIDARDIEFGVHAGLLSIEDFGSDVMYGVSLGYHVTEDFFVESFVGMSEGGKTSFELLAGDVVLLTDDQREFRFYNVSLGYQLLPGESFIGGRRAFNSAMYAAAGVGATDFAGDRRLTWNIGVGYRLLFNDWLALRVDIRDYIFDIDVIGEDKITHNIAIAGGLTVFF